jgi:hypothetical protein
MGTFNKTSSITERDVTMMRVPHPEIGRLWILYLTFIRPLLTVWQAYFNGPRAAGRAKHSLFLGPYRAVTSSELSYHLSLLTERLMHVKISVSRWRHVVTWFMNHNSCLFQKYLTQTAASVLATQMGHSEVTHDLYAGDARVPSGIGFHSFFQTMLTSAVWHKLLGFPPTLLTSMTQHYPGLSELGHNGSPGVVAVKTKAHSDAKEIAAEVLKMITPELQRLHTQTRANDLASFLNILGLDIQTPLSRPFTKLETHITHPSRITALRRFLRDDNATFKHSQQALAVELMASGNSSILLISPTGEHIESSPC